MATEASPVTSVSELLAKFQQAIAEKRSAQPILNRTSFVKLVKEIFIEHDANATPSYADLDAAFTLADEDKSGGLDEFEFLKVSALFYEVLMMEY